MSNVLLSAGNLQTLIQALSSNAELSEEEKKDFADQLNEILVLHTELEKQQETKTQTLIKQKRILQRAEKGKVKVDIPSLLIEIRELENENKELQDKVRKLEKDFEEIINKPKLLDITANTDLELLGKLKEENVYLKSVITEIQRENAALGIEAHSLDQQVRVLKIESAQQAHEINVYENRITQLEDNTKDIAKIRDLYRQQALEEKDTVAKLLKSFEEIYSEGPGNSQITLDFEKMSNQDLITVFRSALSAMPYKADIAKFKGNPSEALNWLDEFESEAEAAGWDTDAIKLRKVKIFLRESAKAWFDANNFNRWVDFTENFKNHYLPSSHSYDLKKKLFQQKQSAFEPVVNFIDRKRQNCTKSDPHMLVQEQVEIILSTMLPEISSRLKPITFLDVDSLISKAKIVEDSLKENPDLSINIVDINKNEKIVSYERDARFENALKTLEQVTKNLHSKPIKERTENGRPFCNFCNRVGHSEQSCFARRANERNRNARANVPYRYNNFRQGNRNFNRYNNNNSSQGNATRNLNVQRNTAASVNVNEEANSYALCVRNRPAKLIAVDCYVDGLKIRGVIDCGCEITMISRQLFNLLKNPIKINDKYNTSAANDSDIKIDGLVEIELELRHSTQGPQNCKMEVIICPEMKKHHCLIGLDYIEEMGLIIDGAKKKITFETPKKEKYDAISGCIYNKKAVILEPNIEKKVEIDFSNMKNIISNIKQCAVSTCNNSCNNMPAKEREHYKLSVVNLEPCTAATKQLPSQGYHVVTNGEVINRSLDPCK